MHFPLLQDIIILLAFSVVIVFLLQRLKLPSVLGFLITGVLIGPHALGLIHAVEQIEIISEIGVILLLFVIGMELSVKQLAQLRKTVLIGGFFQVGITVLVAGLCAYFFGYSINEAVFIGFLFSMSSTAIVLKMLQERNQISSPHGKNVLSILIFQDIIVVPMMLLTPIIAGDTANVGKDILTLFVKSIVVIVITVVVARRVMPKLLFAIAKTKNKELFLLSTMAICFVVAFLTSKAGLSLALGAFLAGLIISDSEYSHQATSIILPFRELFASFFFISIGMMLDVTFFAENIGVILLLVCVVFVIKTIIAAMAVAILKYPARTVMLTGLTLFQVGEFAFILSKVGIEYNVVSAETNQYFLAVSIITMMLTPFVIMYSENITDFYLKTKLGKKTKRQAFVSGNKKEAELTDKLENHIVIIGYGINGANLAKAASYSNIPYVVIELNAATVKRERKKNIPILFGDATQPHILESVHIERARAVVVAISDPIATKNIIINVRHICRTVYLLVRTRYVKETAELLALGADEVIPEEFETSIEIFSRVLHNFLVPMDEIETFTETIRKDNYELLQPTRKRPKTFKPTVIPDFNITCVHVDKDNKKVTGKTIQQLNIRAEFGINILAISRKDEVIYNIGPNQKIRHKDILFVHGKPENIEKFYKHIR
jgi:monovalent cation:H+ antiporter-2, CPA2 family